MKKYTKRPIEVEAVQWTGENLQEIQSILGKDFYSENNGDIYIMTLEGVMRASKGDYIIKGIQNEFYPCKPDIFAKTYEEVV